MRTLAWLLVALPVVVGTYAYVLYPLGLVLLSKRRRYNIQRGKAVSADVSVVIPAYNEEMEIAAAIDAVLGQDYPTERLQILILSDASTDNTDRIVEGYAGRGVELLRMPQRSGKTKLENLACAHIRGEIVVNADASVRLHPAAIRSLVAALADPSVGVASSRDVSISTLDTSANIVEAGYVGFEMRVRRLETQTGGIVGASGSCYAIRAALHRIPVRDDLSRDFSAALTAQLHGNRAVSVDDAICFVPRTASLPMEYRRKVRTISRGINTLYNRRELLDPTRYGLFAWKLLSHKVCRWAVPLLALPAVVGLMLLASFHPAARFVLLGVFLIGGFALAGALWPSGRPMPRILSLTAFAVSANVATVHAVWRVIAQRNDQVWEPTRRSA